MIKLLIPILGALLVGAGTIFQKVLLLKRKKISIKTYLTAEFLAVVIAMLPLLYFFWRLDSAAYEMINVVYLVLIILFSIIANLLVLYSMRWEKISNIEPARMLEPLFVVILAIIFSFIFGEVLFERNLNVIIPTIIASAALVFSHVKKTSFRI